MMADEDETTIPFDTGTNRRRQHDTRSQATGTRRRQPRSGELLSEFSGTAIALAWKSATMASTVSRRSTSSTTNCGKRAGSSIACRRRSGPSACAEVLRGQLAWP